MTALNPIPPYRLYETCRLNIPEHYVDTLEQAYNAYMLSKPASIIGILSNLPSVTPAQPRADQQNRYLALPKPKLAVRVKRDAPVSRRATISSRNVKDALTALMNNTFPQRPKTSHSPRPTATAASLNQSAPPAVHYKPECDEKEPAPFSIRISPPKIESLGPKGIQGPALDEPDAFEL